MRLAAIGLVRNGIRVGALVHDAVLTVCDEDEVEGHCATVGRIMRKAAEVGIGHEIPVDHTVVRYPDHYTDVRGTAMYETILKLLAEIEVGQSGYRAYG